MVLNGVGWCTILADVWNDSDDAGRCGIVPDGMGYVVILDGADGYGVVPDDAECCHNLHLYLPTAQPIL